MARKFSIEATFRAIDRITAPLNKMTGSTAKFSRTIKKDFAKAQRKVENFGRSIRQNMGQAIKVGVATGLIALSAGLAFVTKEFVEFDKSVVNATAKFKDIVPGSEAATKSMEVLRVVARKVGAETQFSATEAAQGLEFLGMAGFTSAQAMKLLPGVVDLATVANVDLARATDIASDALGAMGLMSDDTTQLNKNLTRVMDVMAKTVTSTNTDMEMLFETMKFAGPAFTSAGQDIETFSAIAGRMAANGIKASMAGTAMRSMALRLQAPTKEVNKGLAAFGLVQADLIKDGKLLDLVDIMQLFETGAKNLTTVQRNAALAAIVGKNAFSGWASVMNEGVEQTRLLKTALESSEGAAKKMAAFMRGSLSVRLQILKSSMIELGFKFIEVFEKKGGDALDAFTKAVQNFDPTPVIEGVKTFVSVISGLWSVIKPLLPFIISLVVVFKTYAAIMGVVALAQITLNTAMGATPVGMILIGIGLLIGIFIKLKEWTGSATNAIIVMSAAMVALNIVLVANPIGLIISGVTLLVALFIKLVESSGGVKNAFIVMGKVLMKVVLAPVNMVISSFVKLFTLLSKLPKIGGKFKGLAESLSGYQNKINKPFEITEFDKTGKSFITQSAREITGQGEEEKKSFSAIPTLTSRESIFKSLQETRATNRVVIENQSENKIRSGGQRAGTGQTLMIPESG